MKESIKGRREGRKKGKKKVRKKAGVVNKEKDRKGKNKRREDEWK